MTAPRLRRTDHDAILAAYLRGDAIPLIIERFGCGQPVRTTAGASSRNAPPPPFRFPSCAIPRKQRRRVAPLTSRSPKRPGGANLSTT